MAEKKSKTPSLTQTERLEFLRLIRDDKDKILCRDGKSDSAARKKATWEKVVDTYYLLDLPIIKEYHFNADNG